ncbi:solute carrier family 22 member 16 [Alligator mississippiensis]|uniref:Solute carrier family 22 member 16 n=1 Tax=Alligator mississippiensis TaxID=8496 RepID=A0A151MK05_ALLMI|nr:solute carrier family 22 member 16 [Alligator mississippiensis]
MAPGSERLFDTLGHFGRFQACIYFASVFQAMSCGIHYLASVFMAVTPKFVCSIPGNMENGEIWELNQCSRSRREGSLDLAYEYNGNKSVFSCSHGYIYDHTKWTSTIVTEWDLVCEREWLAKLTQPTFMLGVLIGAVIFGDIADRMGRRHIMWFTSIGQFLFGIVVAFTFDYYSFVVARFLLAMVSSGYLVVVFVYVTEYVGIKVRTWASMHVHAFFALGVMVVALVGFLVRTWYIARRTITVWLIWFTGSLGYYVFSLSSVNLGGNEYLNLFLIGVVELPSYVIACIGMDKLGRRNTLIPSLISSALICVLIMLIPQDFNVLIILANMAGKFTIGVAFGLIYLYTAELYPTIVRSLAVGSGSMMCRVGSVVAPFCVYLTSIWIFMPLLLVGIMAFLSGLLTLMLPETLGRPLTSTLMEAAEMGRKQDISSEKSPPAESGVMLQKIEILSQETRGIEK